MLREHLAAVSIAETSQGAPLRLVLRTGTIEIWKVDVAAPLLLEAVRAAGDSDQDRRDEVAHAVEAVRARLIPVPRRATAPEPAAPAAAQPNAAPRRQPDAEAWACRLDRRRRRSHRHDGDGLQPGRGRGELSGQELDHVRRCSPAAGASPWPLFLCRAARSLRLGAGDHYLAGQRHQRRVQAPAHAGDRDSRRASGA